MQKRPLLFSFLALMLSLTLTLLFVYQQYLISKEQEHEALLHELNIVKDKFRAILNNDITAANTLAIIYKEYGHPKNFDSVASQILKHSKYAEVLQLTKHGIITNVYPLKGYESTIGINTLADSMRRKEAYNALGKEEIYFAGPRKLRMGGIGILGKVPIIIDNELKGFAVVLTRLPAIINALDLDDNGEGKFAYSLSKNNAKSDTTDYLLTKAKPGRNNELVSVVIPEGDWTLYAAYNENYSVQNFPYELCAFGFLFSVIAGLFAYRLAREPYLLKKIIQSKTQQVATSERYFRSLIENSSDAVVLMDATGKVTYQTPSAEKISGYSLVEIRSIDGIELIHPDDREKDNTDFMQLVQNPGSIISNKHRLKKKDGNYILMEGTYQNLLEDENIRSVVLNYRDVTEISTERDRRIKTEERLYATLDNMVVGCKIIGFDWKYLYINNEASNQAFRKKEDIIGKTIYEVHPGVESSNLYAMYKKSMDEHTRVNFEEKYTYTNGVTCWYEIKIEPVDEGIFIMTIDITGKRKTLEDVIHTRHLLGERVKELSAIYNLRNILQEEEQSVDSLFSKIVNILPPGWQYPEVCEARIVFDGSIYTTAGYRPSENKQVAVIETQDGKKGFIEVIYTTETKPETEGPFLKEERDLINTLAETIEVYFNKKSHQDALSDSEARFRGAFEHAAIGVAIVSIKGALLKVNKAFCDMLGYTEPELLSQSFRQITHPDDLGKDLEFMQHTIDGLTDYYRVEKRYIHKDRSIVWANLNTAIIKDSNSKPQYFVSQIENISERIETQLKFQNLVEKSLVGVYILQNGKFAYVNPRICEDSGFTEEELMSIPMDRLVHKDDLQAVYKNIQARLKGHVDSVRHDVRAYKKDGGLLWLEMFGTATLYNGAPAIIGTMVNITEKKEIYNELEKSEANLRSIFDATNISYLLLDNANNIVSVNKYFVKGYERQTGTILKPGMDFIEFALPERREHLKKVFEQVTATLAPAEYEAVYVNKEETKYYNITVSPVIANGTVIGLCMASVDITNRKKLELERQKMIDDLLQKNRDLQQFAFIVSHNVRGPLSTMLGLNSLLKEEEHDESVGFIVEGIGTAAEKLDSVIRDLDQILHVRNDVSELRQQVNFSDIVENVKGSISQTIRNSNAEIECDFTKVHEMQAVSSYMNSIFYNLISNAIKFAKPGIAPRIRIWTELDAGTISINFSDNGTGLDVNRYSDRIFGLYHRFHPQIEGKGLGLFMTKTQVELMNGKIEVSSDPGAGTTFRIFLPV